MRHQLPWQTVHINIGMLDEWMSQKLKYCLESAIREDAARSASDEPLQEHGRWYIASKLRPITCISATPVTSLSEGAAHGASKKDA